MKYSKMWAFKILILSFFAFHLGMHVLYLAPPNPATTSYQDLSDGYMRLFFAQNWHLFAPEPATSSLQVVYRCDSQDEWKYPLKQLFDEHKKNFLTSKGKQTYVLQNLAREIFNGKMAGKMDSEIREIPELQRFIHDSCGRFAQAEIEIRREYTRDYSKRFEITQGKTQIVRLGVKGKSLAWN